MKIYFFAVHDEPEDYTPALATALSAWAEPKTTIQFVHRTDDTDEAPKTALEVELGYELTLSKTQKLKDPLNFLYTLAREHKCEFVVGLINDNNYEDVCYFGYEEGRPDMFEIAHYLGMES